MRQIRTGQCQQMLQEKQTVERLVVHIADARVTTGLYHVRWQIPHIINRSNQSTSVEVGQLDPSKHYSLILASCLLARPLTRFRHILKLLGCICARIIFITSCSFKPD